MALNVCHAIMNQFRGPNDGNFQLVSSLLKELLDNASIRQSQMEEELECLRCLTSNYREDEDRNPSRVPGTCEWGLKHDKFLSWREETNSLL